MKKFGLALMAILLFTMPVGPVITAQESNDRIQKVARDLAEELIANYGVQGVQYAIMDHGSNTLSEGFGKGAEGELVKIEPDTMFGIGSVSKMYVSAATMMLVDSGQIQLDEPLTTYIPEFSMADERYKRITPRMLLNHSSGLHGMHYKNSILFDDTDTYAHDKLLTQLKTEDLKSDPGEFSVYSNDSFQLLEIMVERVSDMSYTQFLDTHISKPLNLSATKTPLNAFDRERLASTALPGLDEELPIESTNVLGTGGLYSTAEELTKFAEVLTGNRPDILSKQAAAAMQYPEYRRGAWVSEERNTFNYGLGWDAVRLAPFSDYGITALSKGGDTVLYHSVLITLPEEQLSMAVVTSGGSSFYNNIFASSVLMEVLKEKGKIKVEKEAQITSADNANLAAPVKEAMPAEMSSHSGLYGTMGTTLEILVKDGEVTLPALMDGLIPAATYVYTGEKQFTSPDGKVSISFERASNGNEYLQVNATLDFGAIGQTVMSYFEAQKLSANPVDAADQSIWKERNGKTYYVLDEKINSVFFLSPEVTTQKLVVADGYANGNKIVDANQALNVLEIPVMMGRDTYHLRFTQQGQTEYMDMRGYRYIREDAIDTLKSDGVSTVTIPASGYAQWFKLGDATAGRVLTVNAAQGGDFVVYDEQGLMLHSSVISDNPTVQLPAKGMIVFGGNPDSTFEIELKDK
ncbi:serine hydrolase domain-containing protein [Paenibacillus massiliensis]|uniref:serine hydrolase domain-containing protein n=1 Tax=Paenibacillus massiliensis TaxID=225917 RepID=UPI00036FF70D|nr:serine hydrolase domain-containing protein [Paenibacillus massiliensis]